MEGGRQPSICPAKDRQLGSSGHLHQARGEKTMLAASALHTLKRFKLRNMKCQLNLNHTSSAYVVCMIKGKAMITACLAHICKSIQ